MRLIDRLAASGNLKAHVSYPTGSLLERVTKTAPVITPSLEWQRTPKGYGVVGTDGTGTLSYGNNATWDAAAAGTLVAVHTPQGNRSAYQTIASKGNWVADTNGFWLWYFSPTEVYGAIADGVASQLILDTTAMVPGVPNMYAIGWNGTTVWGGLNGTPVSTAAQTKTPTPAANNFDVIGLAGARTMRNGPILMAAIVNRSLTSQEFSELYDEWLADGFVLDLPRRHFSFPYDSKTDAAYNAEGIFLDTDFSRLDATHVQDLGPNGYTGTIVGVCPGGPEGEGIVLPTAANAVDWGDVTQLNSAPAFSVEWWGTLPTGNIPAGYLVDKTDDSDDNVRLGCPAVAASPKVLQLDVSNGAAGNKHTTTAVMRGGTRQHVLATFDAGVVTLDVDGVTVASASGGVLPAATASIGASLLTGGNAAQSIPCMHSGTRFHSRALNAAQRRAAYLKHFGQKCTLRETLEDVPVSLAAVPAGGVIGPWSIISGSWQCSETADGKRWLECVTAGCAARPSPDACGTWVVDVYRPIGAGRGMLMFAASQPLAWNTATQNGYCLGFDPANALEIRTITNGGSVATLLSTANGYFAGAQTYRYAINRRSSDGRLELYIRGGAFISPTLVSTAGGAGSNPTAGDATYFTSAWISMSAVAGDKLCLYDPTPGSRCALLHYQGVLNPADGELP